MIKIGKVIGDVIEAGGVKNVTNNYFGQKLDGEGKDVQLSPDDIPAKLKTPEAEELMEELVDAELLTDDWQPTVSRPEAALIADMLATRLDITNKWKMFEHLWHRNNMRADYNTALEQKKSLLFQEKLKNILS